MTHMHHLDNVVDFVKENIFGPSVYEVLNTPVETIPDTGAIGSYQGEYVRFRPTRMYSVGLLHPDPKVQPADESLLSEEEDLAVQAAGIADFVNRTITNPNDEVSEPVEDEIINPFRPRSMGISFSFGATPDATLRVSLQGARYQKFPHGSRLLWQRVPLMFETTFQQKEGTQEVELADSGIRVKVTCNIQTDSLTGYWMTVNVVNVTSVGSRNESTIFQSKLSVELPKDSWTLVDESDDMEFYRDREVRVRGHGCAARVQRKLDHIVLFGEHFPVADTPASAHSLNDLHLPMVGFSSWHETGKVLATKLLDLYQEWIANKKNSHSDLGACERFGDRIEEGIALLDENETARWCFERMNEAMNMQASRGKLPTRFARSGNEEAMFSACTEVALDNNWRPFQLAFILANLAPTCDGAHKMRDTVDVVWMPTGGGKTEAYLGLAAFTILWERLRQGQAGVTVVMRYTLRLLTGQQLQRAASMICALEHIRKSVHASQFNLGENKFAIGAWLGGDATPNRNKDAVVALRKLNNIDVSKKSGAVKRSEEFGFLLRRCPWCAADLVGTNEDNSGYKTVILSANNYEYVQIFCPDEKCDFHAGIPAYDVDDTIYLMRPEMLIGTVDKFARLATLDPSQSRFLWTHRNARECTRAPALVIQDELHLIDGPLGSVAGVYESVLLAIGEKFTGMKARIVGASATSSGTASQVEQLYGRPSQLVPPRGPTVEDSFFTYETEELGKRWLGIFAPNEKPLTIRAKIACLLLLAAEKAKGSGAPLEEYDPWWTNVFFFQSRREVGLAASRFSTAMDSWRRIIQVETGAKPRYFKRPAELTAAAVKNVTKTLDQLEQQANKKDVIDIVFATSMIEVGLDSARLGLMTIAGQPKTAGQYIQVAGRVGRTPGKPGLVITVFNAARPRDMSAFESFHQFHDRLYDHVEYASITPWAAASQRRALAGASAVWMRVTRDLRPRDLKNLNDLRGVLNAIVCNIDPAEIDTLNNELDWLEQALASSRLSDWFDRAEQEVRSFLILAGATLDPDEYASLDDRWSVSENMRSVDKESAIRMATSANDLVEPLKEWSAVLPESPSSVLGTTGDPL